MLNFIKRLFGIKTEGAEVAVTPTVERTDTENDVTKTSVAEKSPTTTSTVEKTATAKPVKKDSSSTSNLNSMTVSQLLDYAATQSIDVKKSWKKAKIVETIAAHSKAN